MTYMFRKHLLLIAIMVVCHFGTAMAQPASVKKAADAVVTLITYQADGTMLSTATGVFVAADGTVISPWKPFDGADHATVVDAKGNKYDVAMMLGANTIYDMAKFRIATSGRIPAYVTLPATTRQPKSGADIWIVPNKKSSQPIKGTVDNAETFMDQYAYLIVRSAATEVYNGSPAFDSNGNLSGLYNKVGDNQSVTDARLASAFQITGLTQTDATLRRCGIRIALPENDPAQAQIALLCTPKENNRNYEALLRDYITFYPTQNEGYMAMAQLALSRQDWAQTETIMNTALQKATNRAEAHGNYARILLQAAGNATPETANAATDRLERALAEAQAAYASSPQPQYRQLEGQVLLVQGKYEQAYNLFMQLTQTDYRNPELFIQALRAKELMQADPKELLALSDSAVALCDTPYTAIAAPYILERAIQRDQNGQYRDAMFDFYQYEALVQGQVDAAFYYTRGQTEMRGKVFQNALNDLAHAVALEPTNAFYWAELASANLRVKKLDEAILAAQRSIDLDEQFADAYLILGIAQAEQNKKAEGIGNIRKAKQLGNAQADTFLEKYQ